MDAYRNPCIVRFAIPFFSCLLCSQSIVASQQDYIEAVEADAEEFFSGTFNPPVDSTWVGSDLQQEAGDAKKQENLESFSAFLKKESPGTYIFFNKLPPELKLKVLEEHVEFGDIERTKKSVFRYATSRKTK